MQMLLVSAGLLIIGFLPHLNNIKIKSITGICTSILKKTVPKIVIEIEKVVRTLGVENKNRWVFLMSTWFVCSFPLGILYMLISNKLFQTSYFIYFLISFSPFLGYFILDIQGKRRYSKINHDIRQVYRALKIVTRAGGSGEDAIKKAIKYTTVLKKHLEGVLINWGEAEYEFLKLRNMINNIEFETLITYLLEIKNDITPELIDNIERQEHQMALQYAKELEEKNKRDDGIAQLSFGLLLLAQFYLVAMPLINENIRIFEAL